MHDKYHRILLDFLKQAQEMNDCEHIWAEYIHPATRRHFLRCEKCRAMKEKGENQHDALR